MIKKTRDMTVERYEPPKKKKAIKPLNLEMACCYYRCDRPGTIQIGKNGNPGTEWICAYHRDKWNADRARFLAEGLPCQMQEL
jgi:hypothetical protein